MARQKLEITDPFRERRTRDPSDFDRIAFALSALRKLRSTGLRVAVYPRLTSFHTQAGSDLRGSGRWAILGIPADASREQIALAIAELAGVGELPYSVAALLTADAHSSLSA